MNRFPFLAWAPFAIWATCSSLQSAEVRIERDISYLGPDRAEKMDAWLPAGEAGNTPAVLVIHGGGWAVGDKADGREKNFCRTLAENGIAAFSINYLLDRVEKLPDGKARTVALGWPQNVEDCKSALRYLKAHAAEWRIDPRRIGVMGGSAGGHLALLLGTTADVAELNGSGLYRDQDNAVACIVDFYGTHDLRQFGHEHFRGGTPEETARNLDLASPKMHLSERTPPILIVHGTADVTIPIGISRDLYRLVQEKGIVCEYIEVPDAPHSFDLQPRQRDLRPEVLAFFRRYLGLSS